MQAMRDEEALRHSRSETTQEQPQCIRIKLLTADLADIGWRFAPQEASPAALVRRSRGAARQTIYDSLSRHRVRRRTGTSVDVAGRERDRRPGAGARQRPGP